MKGKKITPRKVSDNTKQSWNFDLKLIRLIAYKVVVLNRSLYMLSADNITLSF